MADGNEKKNLPVSEQPEPASSEAAGAAVETENGEPIETAPKPEKSVLQKTETKAAELLHLKRRPRPVLPQVRDETTVKVEKILEEGVADAYSRLSPVAKQEFKLKGEETARKISALLKAGQAKAKKIFQLILEWLKMLPGINRFFLEQEAKIKTDRLLALQNKKLN